jgi:hypothetical protein
MHIRRTPGRGITPSSNIQRRSASISAGSVRGSSPLLRGSWAAELSTLVSSLNQCRRELAGGFGVEICAGVDCDDPCHAAVRGNAGSTATTAVTPARPTYDGRGNVTSWSRWPDEVLLAPRTREILLTIAHCLPRMRTSVRPTLRLCPRSRRSGCPCHLSPNVRAASRRLCCDVLELSLGARLLGFQLRRPLAALLQFP